MINKIKQRISPWFRWGDRHLKTDTAYLAGGGVWLVIGQVVAMLAGFLMSLTFAHLISKETFGTYKFILSVAGILGIFSMTEIGTAITRAVANGFGGTLKQGFKINLKWSVGMLIGGFGLGIYYYISGNNVLSISFILAGIFIPITTSASLYAAYLLGKKDFRKITMYGTIRNIVPAAILILTLFLTQNLVIIMAVCFISATITALVLYIITVKKFQKENDKIDMELSTYSRHLSLMQVIGGIANFIDKILVFHYLGAAPLAIYAFAIAPIEQLQGGKKSS